MFRNVSHRPIGAPQPKRSRRAVSDDAGAAADISEHDPAATTSPAAPAPDGRDSAGLPASSGQHRATDHSGGRHADAEEEKLPAGAALGGSSKSKRKGSAIGGRLRKKLAKQRAARQSSSTPVIAAH